MTFVAIAIGGGALIGGGVSLYNSKKARDASKGQSIGTSNEILNNFNKRTDESGVRGQMAKYSQLSDMFGQEAGRNYLDTTEGQSLSKQIERSSDRGRRSLTQNASMMNLSPEAYLKGLGQLNQSEGDSFRNIITGADNRRNMMRSQQMSALGQVLGAEQGLFGAQQSRFAQSYGIGSGIAQGAANAQANSNQNTMAMLGQLGQAGAMFAGSGGFGGGGGGTPSNAWMGSQQSNPNIWG
jgi:hypothetical protein